MVQLMSLGQSHLLERVVRDEMDKFSGKHLCSNKSSVKWMKNVMLMEMPEG